MRTKGIHLNTIIKNYKVMFNLVLDYKTNKLQWVLGEITALTILLARNFPFEELKQITDKYLEQLNNGKIPEEIMDQKD